MHVDAAFERHMGYTLAASQCNALRWVRLSSCTMYASKLTVRRALRAFTGWNIFACMTNGIRLLTRGGKDSERIS